jgi:hypothetical protein
MKTLKEELEEFEKQILKQKINEFTDRKERHKRQKLLKLQREFIKLASAFLYGGYIQVRDDYRVYIRTVEFYFHCEKENGIHDPIVYHRNRRDYDGYVLEEVPYFQLMKLNAHNSGFDITFESENGEYRASALIRSYEIKNKDGMYLVWDTIERTFKTRVYGYNKQSTYLYTFLNGFSLGESNNIYWIDDFKKHSDIPKGEPRQNVFKSANDFEYKKLVGKRCTREWSFTRKEQV